LDLLQLAPRSMAEPSTGPTLCRVPDYAECLISAGDSQAGGNKRFGIVRCATGLTYWGDETFR
jgi:hypothetical protein